MTIKFEVKGSKELVKKLKKYSTLGDQVSRKTLFQEAEKIMADSKKNYVPVVTGVLRGSGTVELPKIVDGKITVTMGYGGAAAKYALIVHENPRSGKTQGTSPQGGKYKNYSKVGQWKYLEVPFNKRSGKIGRAISVNMNKTLKATK